MNIKEENYSEGDLFLSFIYVDKIFKYNNIKQVDKRLGKLEDICLKFFSGLLVIVGHAVLAGISSKPIFSI